jgi:Protein of unknown function (DUF2530)
VNRPHPPPPEPLDVDAVGVTTVGTVLWAVAGLGLLPFRGWLADHGVTWWLWTCLAGFTLGLYGCWFVRRRRDRLRRLAGTAPESAEQEAEAPPI